MPNTKPTVAARVPEWVREWISQEASRRDRKKSYVIEELLREGIQRREGDGEESEVVPA